MRIVRSADMVVESIECGVRVLVPEGGEDGEVRPVFGPSIAETPSKKAKARSRSHRPSPTPLVLSALSSPSSSKVAFRAWNDPFMGLWPRHGPSNSNPTFGYADDDLGTDTVLVLPTSLQSDHFNTADTQKDRPDCAITYSSESTVRSRPDSRYSAQSSSHSLPDSVLSCEEAYHQFTHGHDVRGLTGSHDNVTRNVFSPPIFDVGYEEARVKEVSEADTPPLTPMSPRLQRYKPRPYGSYTPEDGHDDDVEQDVGSKMAASPSKTAGLLAEPAETDSLLAIPTSPASMATLPLPVTTSNVRIAPSLSFTRLESFVQFLAILITSALITLSIYLTLANIRM